ncbi:MAG: hypothetical protein LUD41_05175, partial [Phascolarctobacterium sp.]|nr:hypothetical protein [Phascolarctobacterium sp.]
GFNRYGFFNCSTSFYNLPKIVYFCKKGDFSLNFKKFALLLKAPQKKSYFCHFSIVFSEFCGTII